MIDVCLLGTGGMMPLPNRWLTSLLVRYNGNSILIDCGEGTQIALAEANLSPNPVSVICFTHYHADHISGLPGFLLAMGNADRTEPVTIIGPKGLERVVSALRVIAPQLPFEIKFHELEETEEYIEVLGLRLHAFRVNHNVTCYGYGIELDRAGKFDLEAAKRLEIPLKAWNPLQKGNIVEVDGVTYTPDMVMGEARKGLKVVYCTDTRPTEAIISAATDADLLILEGMYGEKEKAADARKKKHMTFYEAAEIAAASSGVKKLWLTHFSPSMIAPHRYMKEVKQIFHSTSLGKDGKFLELNFIDEE